MMTHLIIFTTCVTETVGVFPYFMILLSAFPVKKFVAKGNYNNCVTIGCISGYWVSDIGLRQDRELSGRELQALMSILAPMEEEYMDVDPRDERLEYPPDPRYARHEEAQPRDPELDIWLPPDSMSVSVPYNDEDPDMSHHRKVTIVQNISPGMYPEDRDFRLDRNPDMSPLGRPHDLDMRVRTAKLPGQSYEAPVTYSKSEEKMYQDSENSYLDQAQRLPDRLEYQDRQENYPERYPDELERHPERKERYPELPEGYLDRNGRYPVDQRFPERNEDYPEQRRGLRDSKTYEDEAGTTERHRREWYKDNQGESEGAERYVELIRSGRESQKWSKDNQHDQGVSEGPERYVELIRPGKESQKWNKDSQGLSDGQERYVELQRPGKESQKWNKESQGLSEGQERYVELQRPGKESQKWNRDNQGMSEGQERYMELQRPGKESQKWNRDNQGMSEGQERYVELQRPGKESQKWYKKVEEKGTADDRMQSVKPASSSGLSVQAYLQRNRDNTTSRSNTDQHRADMSRDLYKKRSIQESLSPTRQQQHPDGSSEKHQMAMAHTPKRTRWDDSYSPNVSPQKLTTQTVTPLESHKTAPTGQMWRHRSHDISDQDYSAPQKHTTSASTSSSSKTTYKASKKVDVRDRPYDKERGSMIESPRQQQQKVDVRDRPYDKERSMMIDSPRQQQQFQNPNAEDDSEWRVPPSRGPSGREHEEPRRRKKNRKSQRELSRAQPEQTNKSAMDRYKTAAFAEEAKHARNIQTIQPAARRPEVTSSLVETPGATTAKVPTASRKNTGDQYMGRETWKSQKSFECPKGCGFQTHLSAYLDVHKKQCNYSAPGQGSEQLMECRWKCGIRTLGKIQLEMHEQFCPLAKKTLPGEYIGFTLVLLLIL